MPTRTRHRIEGLCKHVPKGIAGGLWTPFTVLPTDLPVVEANELRIDRIFELEDGSFAIIDYESTYKSIHKIKYLGYIVRILRKYRKTKDITIRMIVLYTADVERKNTKDTLDAGAVKLTIYQSFLSELDSEAIKYRLTAKIQQKKPFTDRELMEFVILPLTCRGETAKKKCIKQMFEAAKGIPDEHTQVFLISGILVFADKVIDAETAKQMKGWMMMTKVARLFEEEKLKAIAENEERVRKEVTEKVTQSVEREVTRKNALAMLKCGKLTVEEAAMVFDLDIEEVRELAKAIK